MSHIAPLLSRLARLARAAEAERSIESLLGIEGTAARLYFSRFSSLLKDPPSAFAFEERNRRPPKDPVNALLSFLYTLLIKDVTTAIVAAGLDSYIGVYTALGSAGQHSRSISRRSSDRSSATPR